MYWEPDNESMHREELEQLQLERLQATLNRVYGRVPFYRKQLDAAGVAPEDVVSLGDLARLPFTTKADLRDNYPYGLFAVPMREVVRIHASSGTTGTPTVVGYTRNDIRTWSNLVARILTMGASPRTTSSRSPSATGCSPGRSACTTAPNGWGHRSSRPPAGTRRGRSRSCRTSRRPRWSPRRPMRC